MTITRTLHGDELSWLHLMLIGALPSRYVIPSMSAEWHHPALHIEPEQAVPGVESGTTVSLLDPEGVTLATVGVEQVQDGWVAGPVSEMSGFSIADHLANRRNPAETAADFTAGTQWALWSATPVTHQVREAAETMARAEGARLIEIAAVPTGAETSRSANAPVRLALAAAPSSNDVLVVPMPRNVPWDAAGVRLRAQIAASFGFDALVTAAATDGLDANVVVGGTSSAPIAVRRLDVPPERATISREMLDAWVTDGVPLPEWAAEEAVANELRRVHRPAALTGFTVLLSGLSGSGKSTVARSLAVRLMEREARSVSLLDGDVVRHHLSKGLGFTRPDRITNVLRIGFVASEITKAGGIAICCPIAPYDETRKQVREMVQEHGRFVLVHVATPLEECERRDRKGLYAKARRGEIPEFTGISDPYEEPADAELVIDTTGRSIDDCVGEVLSTLRALGLVQDD